MNTSFELQEDGVIVMNVAGEVDVFAAAEFKDGLFRCLDQGARRLIIDMTGSCFIDSTGQFQSLWLFRLNNVAADGE